MKRVKGEGVVVVVVEQIRHIYSTFIQPFPCTVFLFPLFFFFFFLLPLKLEYPRKTFSSFFPSPLSFSLTKNEAAHTHIYPFHITTVTFGMRHIYWHSTPSVSTSQPNKHSMTDAPHNSNNNNHGIFRRPSLPPH